MHALHYKVHTIRKDIHFQINFLQIGLKGHTLSEETAQPTVYHHPSQVSVDMQLSGLIKCREDTGVLF